ncbi:MAG: right-handed parallel beta-helix repeat-containing protein [bacterium]
MRRHRCLVACALLLGVCDGACGGGGGGTDTNQNNSACAEGYEQSGAACIPLFDDCPGSAEIAVLGGGCRVVGVTTCATGLFEPDGEDGCAPILPEHSCPAGTMEQLGLTECQPVGVTACGAGFESDGEGGCDAVLPPGPDPCPSGTIALLGHTTCQPLGDCGTGTWGTIVDDGSTVYVDQTADATGADGTQQAPFVTVGEALAVVVPGGRLALAAGDYIERLGINKEVRLTGRCAELVTIRGTVFLGDPRPPVTITAGGTGTTIRGVTLTGPGEGLVISGAQQVVLSQLQVRDAGDVGISAQEGAEVSLQQVVVAGCATIGVVSSASTLGLEQSVVRDTRPQPGTGLFGRGINVECSPWGDCGSLLISSSLVSGNCEMGIFAFGVDTEITATVVRDTLPEQSAGTSGRGIAAQCYPLTGDCGSLLVSSSVVSGNREAGIAGIGVDAEINATVVRDTLPEESTGEVGRGIHSQCELETGACGGLRVSSCLVSGNRNAGISAAGVDTEVFATVVRNTLPEQSTGWFGRGISVTCDAEAGVCGSLLVSSCLVSGNRDAGIVPSGVDAEITATVVRDTLPEEDTGLFGRGIGASCDLAAGACGSLRVSSCLVTNNRDVGIAATGVDTEVFATVVRDTLSIQSDGKGGRGINAQCDPEARACGSLRVSSCLVTGNRDVGIAAAGADTEVTGTVVRDTLAQQSDGTSGRGIGSQCDLEAGVCGSLQVSSSLVSGNRDVGITAIGTDTEIFATVVRDTLPEESTGSSGRGIGADCYPEVGACGRLQVSSSLISGNRNAGIAVIGVDTEVFATVVRDTLPDEGTAVFGRGINIQCYPAMGACGSLQVSSSLVAGSENVGIFIAGAPATLEGVAVIDTLANTQYGSWYGIYGQGIWALCDGRTGDCGGLSVTSCLVDSSQSAGVAVEGISGFIASSVVRSVAPQPLDGKYGYGIQIGGLEGEALPTFNVNDCEIRDAELAGVLYFRSRGTLARSVVSGGENSVIMNEGSEPNILGDNNLSGTVTDEPTWANHYPSPAPTPALPSDPAAQ